VVKACHCTCMAGLGEACSHVAALLFAINATTQIRDSKTVTKKPAYWMLPPEVKNIRYEEIREMNFASAKTMKRNLDTMIGGNSTPVTPRVSKTNKKKVPPPTTQELHASSRHCIILVQSLFCCPLSPLTHTALCPKL